MARASAISLSSYTYSMSSMLKEEDDEGLVCSPLRTLRDVKNFIKNPPVWRSLCVELKPHSDYAIRNMDIVKQNKIGKDIVIELTEPETFCHFDPSHEDVARHRRKSLPKTLVCHDMANGYHDDCKVDGTLNFEAYTFYNWAVVDIFCYFSHHLVTIPPLGWINVGHEHGVKVIGTVVTEWAVGAQIWDQLLATPREWQEFASTLVSIAKTLKFDGWLLNIENMVKQPETLLQFVQHLHSLLHQELEDPVLLWYDSVNMNGELLWQNALNEKNKPFFDACDGIFTNYSWSERDVQASRAAAGSRHRDVFVGIDVWGRNFIGGGQFNSQEAMKIIYSNDCSVAIFAPAWTHEALDEEQAQISTVGRAAELDVLDSFVLRERALWGALWPFLHTKLPCALPFASAFCRGQGRRRRLCGEVLSSGAWYNLRHQQYQPNAAHGPHAYLLSSAQGLRAVHARGLQYAYGAGKLRESFHSRESPAQLPPPARAKSAEPAQPPERARLAQRAKSAEPAQPSERAKSAEPASSSETDEAVDHPQPYDRKLSFKDKFKSSLRKTFDSFKKKKNRRDTPIGSLLEESPSVTSSGPGRASRELCFQLRIGRRPDKKQLALVFVANEAECLEAYMKDSFTGGSCLAVHPCDEMNTQHRFTRLFHCDFAVDGRLVACVVTKRLPGAPDQALAVVLAARDGSGPERRVALASREAPGLPAQDVHPPLNPSSDQFKSLQNYLLLREPDFYVAVDNSYGWDVRYYEAQVRGRVTSVNCRTEESTGPILLGHFGLCERNDVY